MHTQGRQGRWPHEDRGGILLPGAKECPGLQRAPRAGGGKEGLSPEPAEGTRLGQPLYFGFLAPRIVRGYISIVLAGFWNFVAVGTEMKNTAPHHSRCCGCLSAFSGLPWRSPAVQCVQHVSNLKCQCLCACRLSLNARASPAGHRAGCKHQELMPQEAACSQ